MNFKNSASDSDKNGFGQTILTVSELNFKLKTILEEKFPFIWIYGEISNFRVPGSGHFYFTLKDEESQLSAVMFRGQQRNLKFIPEDGLSVTGMGRISVYEPRGTYQIILEYMEPSGIGALQVAFEKLKKRLSAEGYFDDIHKKELPFLPQTIALITSPTGAVVHDMLHIINRRFPGVAIEIFPVRVQGDGAAQEIAAAIEFANGRATAEVIILARGGGSLEDLQAFNSETVASAILTSKTPIISAVGHETDYTISDFVADLRAPTPSAAAEIVLPKLTNLQRRCVELQNYIIKAFQLYTNELRNNCTALSRRLIDPRRKIQDFQLKLDDLNQRLHRQLGVTTRINRERLAWWNKRLFANTPLNRLQISQAELYKLKNNIFISLQYINKDKQSQLRQLTIGIEALNPISILERGYSITRVLPELSVVRDTDEVEIDQNLDITVARGSLVCRVEGKSSNAKKNI